MDAGAVKLELTVRQGLQDRQSPGLRGNHRRREGAQRLRHARAGRRDRRHPGRDTGTFERLQALIKNPDSVPLRRAVLDNLLYNNRDYDPGYALTREMVKVGNKLGAVTALLAFGIGGGNKPDETCQSYFDNIGSSDENMAAVAFDNLARWGRCAGKFEPMLDSLERRFKATNAPVAVSYCWSIRYLCEDGNANAAQKKRAAANVRKILQRKENRPAARAFAWEAVLVCDPSRRRPLHSRYAAERRGAKRC